MTYYNGNDGLYYEDENFTILANGWFNDAYVYYIDGNYTTLDSNGNGFDYYYYWAYFIGGVMTTLDFDGNGEWNGDTYVNGVITINGWVDGFYYINNVATTLDSTGSGTWNGNTYINGERQYNGLTDGLQAFYKLDDLTDSSENGNTLTNIGGVTFGSGKIGNAAIFNGGGDDYLEKSNTYTGNSAASFFCWANMNSTPDHKAFGMAGTQSSGMWLLFYDVSTSRLVCGANLGSGWSDKAFGTSSISPNEWVHVGFTYDGSNIKLYKNGQLDSSTPASGNFASSTNDIYIGKEGSWSSQDYSGKLDAVGIWDRPLNSSEISALYNDGNGLEDLNPPAPSGAVSVRIQGNTKFFGKVKFT